MIVEGVNFVEDVCAKMSKEEFIERHKDAFWQDRDEETRRQMLSDAYDMIKPPKKEVRRKPASKVEEK